MKKENFSSIEKYIAAQSEPAKEKLNKLWLIIKKVAPNAEEVISYNMPAFKLHGILVYFAAFKDHYSLFATPKPIVVFKDKLKGYETSKGTIRFRLDKPVPVKLITEIIKYRVKENLEKELRKKSKKKK